MEDQNLMSITEACYKYHVTRQAIFGCIQSGRLNAKKSGHKWIFSEKDWEDYIKSKYSRKFSTRDGDKIYDVENGQMSPSMISSNYGIDKQQLYYMMRKGRLPFRKSGCSYIIDINDFLNSREKIKSSKKKT